MLSNCCLISVTWLSSLYKVWSDSQSSSQKLPGQKARTESLPSFVYLSLNNSPMICLQNGLIFDEFYGIRRRCYLKYCKVLKTLRFGHADHLEKCEQLRADVNISCRKLPTMYWIPKLHKNHIKPDLQITLVHVQLHLSLNVCLLV